ncbi:MAG TPA: hypothetical protein VIW73_00815 [Candidatus Cybelea sp.]
MANIYNALDFGLDPSNTASGNQVALQDAVTQAQQNFGGQIVIPSFGSYSISGTVTITADITTAIHIVGSSGSALFVKNDASDLFSITNTNAGDGVFFEDIHVRYSGTFSNVAAFRFARCRNGRLHRVTMEDCPLGAVFSDCQQCSVSECRSLYGAQNNSTLITIDTAGFGGTSQTRIYACDFEVGTTATGCAGLSVTQSSDLSVDDSLFAGFANAITIAAASAQSVVRSLFRGISCQTTSTAVTVKLK